jgi:type IV pilus assembly protein PilM
MIFPFKFGFKSNLGIDIGTSGVRIVQLAKRGERVVLEKYGEIGARVFYEESARTFEKSTLLLSTHDIARAILAICQEAKITEKKAFFAIPDFASFFTSFELPPMTREEVPQAVRFEARHYIPLPLAEVTLDWSIVEGEADERRKTPLKILLVAVSNDLLDQYSQIANLANLELKGLEVEAFSLVRALAGEEKEVMVILDIGARSTTINIVDQGILKVSHSFDVAGNEMTQVLAKALDVDFFEAENLKKAHGLKYFFPEEFKEEEEKKLIVKKVGEILMPLVDLILAELERTDQSFSQLTGKRIEKVILAGGSSLLPGLKEYFLKVLKKKVEIANPFSKIFYPPILESVLKEIGPSYAIAVGAALRGLE